MPEFTHIHKKTGNRYAYFMACVIKINGEWKPGVTYMDANNVVYVRELQDFLDKFEPINE